MENNVLNKCNLYSINITSKNGEKLELGSVFTRFDIYEDIFGKYLGGMLFIRDTSDMLKNFPIIGGEHVEISFADSEYNSARFFDFYIDEVLPQPVSSNELNKNTVLGFKLISKDQIEALKMRFSYRFKDYSFTIIQQLFSAIKSNKNLGDTQSSISMDFVANFWNVDEIIDYISYQNKDCLFFETSDQYRFESLSKLVAQTPVQELFMLKNLEGKAGINIVQQYHFDKFFSIMKMFQSGGFGKTVYQPDLEGYNFQTNFKTLDDIYSDYPLMGRNKMFLSALSSFDNEIDVEYDDIETALKRNIILSTLQHYNLVVQINGSLRRKVGDKVIFNLPSFDNTPINQNFHNEWLILQIKHIVESNLTYKQNMRLFKNAFFDNPKVG